MSSVPNKNHLVEKIINIIRILANSLLIKILTKQLRWKVQY